MRHAKEWVRFIYENKNKNYAIEYVYFAITTNANDRFSQLTVANQFHLGVAVLNGCIYVFGGTPEYGGMYCAILSK